MTMTKNSRQTLILAVVALAAVSALVWIARPRAAGDPDAAPYVVTPDPELAPEGGAGQRESLVAVPEDLFGGAGLPTEPAPPQPEPTAAPEVPLPVGEPTYEEKYAGMDRDELAAALRQLQARQSQLARELAQERYAQGQFRVEGPISKEEGYVGEAFLDHPLQHRPTLIEFETKDIPGTDEITVDVVEISPSDTPELRALRDEEVWLTHQLEIRK